MLGTIKYIVALFLLAGIRYGTHNVRLNFDFRIGNVIVRAFTVPKAKTVMVFGGQDDRTHTGLFGVPNPLGSLGFNVSRWIVDRQTAVPSLHSAFR